MALAPGTVLGPYEVVALLGAGGMGEVFRARDSRLHRDVALKILPADVAGDPDRRSRFERESRAIAALSHPNVLSVFDVGVAGSITYAVTELLEGKSLREHLTGGALPVRKAIDIAVQMARGLSAAHDKGIVHRDVKPDNVFVLDDGRVKVLDFGLARSAVDAAGDTVAGTDPGVVMGTGSLRQRRGRVHARHVLRNACMDVDRQNVVDQLVLAEIDVHGGYGDEKCLIHGSSGRVIASQEGPGGQSQIFAHVVRIGVPHQLSGLRERPCIVHDSGRRTIRLPDGLASGCTGQQRVDNAASLLVCEFAQHGTNERAQLGSRHRLEGPAEIRVSRSSTARARTPTDHYSVPYEASHRRANLYLCASL